MNKFLKENRGTLLFIALMLVFRSAIADWNDVPTGSMKPTILEGDRILVNKMAYDLRVPFTHISLYKRADPARGDIIIFDSKASDNRLVKRVIGVPGDAVQMVDNVLFVNGEQLSYSSTEQSIAPFPYVDLQEDLVGLKHRVRISQRPTTLSSFPPVVVPDGYYLALGDNRDQSADSRVIGFVPREEIVGRSSSVAFSLNYDNYYLPRKDRLFTAL